MITATIPVQMTTMQTGASTREQNTTTATHSGVVGHVARVIVAVGLTALLLWQSDPRAVWQAARGADWRFIALACGLVVIDRVLMAYRWWTLLAPLDRTAGSVELQVGPSTVRSADLQVGRRPPVATVMRIFFVSTFVGTFQIGRAHV